MKSSLLFFLLVFAPWLGFSQLPGMLNYTTYDGLPSDEVFRGLLAKDGYMWFATNDGVCRFDGSEFTTYELTDGLTENTIIDISEDKEGRIWFVGISGKLSYFENEKIFPFESNDLISASKTTVDIPCSGLFMPISKTEIKLSLFSGKTIHIKDKRGTVYLFENNDSIPISNSNDEYLFYVKRHLVNKLAFFVVFDSVPIKVEVTTDESWGHSYSRYLYVEFSDKVVYFYRSKAITIYKNGDYKITKMDVIPMCAIKSVEKGIWIGTFKKGISYYPNSDFEQEPLVHYLDKQFVTSLMYDQNDRGWVSTSYGGVFNIQTLAITNFYKEGRYLENYVSRIVEIEPKTFIFFARNNRVFLSRDIKLPMEELVLDELESQLVYQAKLYGDVVLVATSAGLLEIPLQYFLNPSHPKKGIRRYKFGSIKDFLCKDSILWIGTSRGLFYERDFLNNRKFAPIRVGENQKRIKKIISLPSDNKADSAFSYILYQNMKNLEMLRYIPYREKKLFTNYTTYDQEGKHILNNDILVRDKDQAIFLATKGDGIQIVTDDSLIIFNKESGLLSNTINRLKMPFDTILLAGTNKGLNIIKLSEGKYPKILMSKFITTKDGLKGNEIHDIACYGDRVLVSTNMGISIINIFAVVKMKDIYPVYITDFIVNGKNKPVDTVYCSNLSYFENNIQIKFNALDFHDKAEIKYYYRLIGAEEKGWEEINKNSVVYPELSSGSYVFQVKAKNSYGFSSKNMTSITFEISQVYYQTFLFKFVVILTLILLIGGYLFMFFKERNNILKNKSILDNYQQKSLMRIMNPHFIFNALNSVNSFIVTNKKKDATMYVSEIASLIRQVFNKATDDSISVLDEVTLLDTYLKLEQRRLNDVFDYLIKYDDDLKNNLIPSFMIQVFVENSVWHGLPNKTEKGAFISIVFKKHNKHVLCEIVDNGVGRKTASKTTHRKSRNSEKHGIDIIKQRIDLLNKRYKTEVIKLKMEDLYNEKETKALGTKISLQFPFIIYETIANN